MPRDGGLGRINKKSTIQGDRSEAGAGARYGDGTEKGAVGPVGGDICWPVMTQRGFMVYEREGH